MKCRENTYDSEIAREVQHGAYKKLVVTEDDIVLDLGAHIGSYVCLIAPNVKRVVCYEADPNNFEVLKENTKGLLNVEIHNQAVYYKNGFVTMWRVTKPKGKTSSVNTGMTSVVERRGREPFNQETVSFQDVLNAVQPTKIKCDIEGGEYFIFKEPLIIPQSVKEIMFEIHVKTDDLKVMYQPFEIYLNSNDFFEVDKKIFAGWYQRKLFRRR